MKKYTKLETKLEKGKSKMAVCQGVLVCCWKNIKDVLIMSKCHKPSEIMVKRKKLELEDVTCPKAIADYNKYMGYVDLPIK